MWMFLGIEKRSDAYNDGHIFTYNSWMSRSFLYIFCIDTIASAKLYRVYKTAQFSWAHHCVELIERQKLYKNRIGNRKRQNKKKKLGRKMSSYK